MTTIRSATPVSTLYRPITLPSGPSSNAVAPRPSVVTDELARRSHGEVDRPLHRQRHRAANLAARREHEHAPVHPVRDADRPVRRDVVARWAEGLLVADTADTADLPGPVAVRQLGYDAVARTNNLEIESDPATRPARNPAVVTTRNADAAPPSGN